MKFITYLGIDLLTGDTVAGAAFTFATALALRSRTDGVELPVINEYGSVSFVSMTLGYAIPTLVRDAPEDELEPEFPSCVGDLERRTLELQFQT